MPPSACVPTGSTAIKVVTVISTRIHVTTKCTNQRRPLGGGRIVPLLFLPVLGITTGCRKAVVVGWTEYRAPVCSGGKLRVTRGDTFGSNNGRVTPAPVCICGCCVDGETTSIGRGVVPGKDSCSTGESSATNPGRCNGSLLAFCSLAALF